jgi:hypothetical protein
LTKFEVDRSVDLEKLDSMRLLMTKVYDLLKLGKTKEAIELTFDMQSLAEGFMNSSYDLFDLTLNLQLLKMSRDILLDVLQNYEFSDDDLDLIKGELELNVLDIVKARDNAVKMEAWLSLNTIDSIDNSVFGSNDELTGIEKFLYWSSYHFRVNKTKNLVIDYYSDFVKDPYNLLKGENVKQKLDDQLGSARTFNMLVSNNSAGNRFLQINIFKNPSCEVARDQFLKGAIVTLSALEQYYLENSQYPESIGDLKSDFLDRIPDDPLAKGFKIGYDGSKKKIFSVGTGNQCYDKLPGEFEIEFGERHAGDDKRLR